MNICVIHSSFSTGQGTMSYVTTDKGDAIVHSLNNERELVESIIIPNLYKDWQTIRHFKGREIFRP